MEKPQLSICIPTYNRGEIVKRTIENLLKYKDETIEIVVSNNGSTDNTDELLRSINDSRLIYFENISNKGFNYNLIKVIEYARANIVILLSDEDDLELHSILDIITIAKSNPNFSVILGSVYNKRNTYLIRYKDRIFKKGEIAFKNHSFTHQYMSGLVFNKNLIDFDDLWIEQNRQNYGYLDIYPQVYILNNLCFEGDVITIKNVICRQRDLGKASEDTVGVNAYIKPIERINLFQKNIKSLSKYNIKSSTYIQTFINLYNWTLNQILNYNIIRHNKDIATYFKLVDNNASTSDLKLLNFQAFDLVENSNLISYQKKKLKNKIAFFFKIHVIKYYTKRILKKIIKFDYINRKWRNL